MPACDTCRIRKVCTSTSFRTSCNTQAKIRCDRNTPCSACSQAGFECTVSSRQSRAAHRSEPVSKKRIGTVPIAVKAKTILASNTPRQQDVPATIAVSGPSAGLTTSYNLADFSELPNVSLVDSESVGLTGESSLHADSIAARDLLIRTLGNDSHIRHNPRIVTALSSLRQIVQTDKKGPAQKKIKLACVVEPKPSIYELELLPSEIVFDILRESKERRSFIFSPPLAYVTYDEFRELCKTVYSRIEHYPVSTAIIVHGILRNLILETKWSRREPLMSQRYEDYAQLCCRNLEISLSSLELLLPASKENAQALLVAASHCMETAQASACKSFVVHGCMMVQALGWHRAASMEDDDDQVRQQKLVIFWLLYIIDKNLSLRLGQASLIQDHDLGIPIPDNKSTDGPVRLGRICKWVTSARIMSLVYEQLYSPASLRQTDDTRFNTVNHLLRQIEAIEPESIRNNDVSDFMQCTDRDPDPHIVDGANIIYSSDEIIYYALLCMIYRATPTSSKPNYDPAAECIRCARAALDCHRRCTEAYKGRIEMWTTYLNWTILNTPFVPFTTLFSHVLTTHNRADLDRLQQFAQSMSDSPTNQPAHKVYRITSIFVEVAAIYVEAKELDKRNQQSRQESTPMPSNTSCERNDAGLYQQVPTMTLAEPALDVFNPFLDALGFTDDQMWGTHESSNTGGNLEDWFNGNQHIMGLLEEDLNYFDGVI